MAPSEYLARLEAGRKDDPPISPAIMDSYVQTHCISPKLLRADAFDLFMKDRQQRLLELIAKATGHDIDKASSPADEVEVPDNIAEDSGLLASAAT